MCTGTCARGSFPLLAGPGKQASLSAAIEKIWHASVDLRLPWQPLTLDTHLGAFKACSLT